ncbi:non-homologous end joining protein Ku [Halopseudomonas bauzanensis]|uniref:Non-homologous end joining protein Ku n=1 Tax=Halopseudomonas bauzanensis TaxID=653930 RepID=A0A1H9Q2U2_9GAMM|nr:Ku protein [Halopseudomonas bauzanensis]SER54728.1 DNA end-binding protein Ku [Halopseudomonas bauzanensis]SFL69410.1 DNA end-binding protein Ku [Halopseudomonas bauzanensis]
MARAIWKGAISFGLVHIPVSLVSATSSSGVDFDWLDERTMDPVGYKRVNKVTGKEVAREHIVKGVELEKGNYVVISEEEIQAALPEATQTIDIFSFIDSAAIPLLHISKPYFLAPDRRGEKVYALLRETLISTGKVALAHVVVRTKQSLAALMPLDSALALIMLRWPSEVRDIAYLELKSSVTKAKPTAKELDMAKRLVEDMAGEWEPDEYRNTFEDEIMALVEEKASAGEIQAVETVEQDEERQTADVVDLTELLKRSLGGAKNAKGSKDSKGGKGGTRKVSDSGAGTSRRKKSG